MSVVIEEVKPLVWRKGNNDPVFGQRWEAQRLNSYRIYKHGKWWGVSYRLFCNQDRLVMSEEYTTLREAKERCAHFDAWTLAWVKDAANTVPRGHLHHAVCSCGKELTS